MALVAIKKPPVKTPADMARSMKLLIYGQPGAGKTYFIGSGAHDVETFGRILILCPDPGTLTLAFDPVMASGIDVAEISSTNELETWYTYLKIENSKMSDDNPEKYRTIALDSLTDISEMAMLESLDKTSAENPGRDPDMPGVDHHQRVAIISRREIRRFRDLAATFIATALEKTQIDNATGKIYISPALGGKLSAEVAAYFDIVGYMHTDTVKDKVTGKESIVRRMRVQPDGKIIAKDRTRRLGYVVDNASLTELVTRIKSGEYILPEDLVISADPKIKQKTFTAK